VLVVSDTRWALMHELHGAPEPSLRELLAKLAPADIVLIEGFKRSPHPKIEVFRAANGKAPLHPGDDSIIAVASDIAFPEAGRPVLSLDDVTAITDFILAHASES
jgi:molybdopterin-guanine dinucleotide biosynthesis protein B